MQWYNIGLKQKLFRTDTNGKYIRDIVMGGGGNWHLPTAHTHPATPFPLKKIDPPLDFFLREQFLLRYIGSGYMHYCKCYFSHLQVHASY